MGGGGGSGPTPRLKVVAFGPFELVPEQRRLLRDGRPVPLGSRALDILLTLIDSAGALLSKEELIAKVWPETFVEEGALRVHVTALRKVLNDGRPDSRDLVNVPGRGYQFTAPVRLIERDGPEALPQPSDVPTSGVPAPRTRVVGRDAEVDQVIGRLRLSGCVTIVGTGGIGKTTVALVAARAAASSFDDGAVFVDLAPVTQADHLLEAVGARLGVPREEPQSVARLADFLASKALLLVLDNCEQVAAEVAAVVERVLAASTRLRVLVTSREPLHVADESVYRLPPLATPARGARPTAREAMTFPAVQLFVERATAVADRFVLDDINAPVVAGLCGQLDGLALAIEMAATRMDSFGIADIAAMLDDRFEFLRRSQRGSSDRQSSLSATLDWSYGMLGARQKAFLRDLSALSGRFTLDDAVGLTRAEALGRAEIAELLGELVDKSFVTVDPTTSNATYRMFETMREYVRHRTCGTPEYAEGRRRHARFVADALTRAERATERRPRDEWIAAHGRHLDDVGSAIRWCLADGNDTELGVDITARAITLWTEMSLPGEMVRHTEAAFRAMPCEARRETPRAIRLRAALSHAMADLGLPPPEATRVGLSSLEAANREDDPAGRVKAFPSGGDHGLRRRGVPHGIQFTAAHAHVALGLEPTAALVARRTAGASDPNLGDAQTDCRHVEPTAGGRGMTARPGYATRFGSERLASARGLLAAHQCIQGYFDTAMQGTRESALEALGSGHAMTVCSVLGTSSIPNAIQTGYLEEASALVTTLRDTASSHGLHRWEVLAIGYEGLLDLRAGHEGAGLDKLSHAVAGCDDRADTRFLHVCSEYALALGRAGHVGPGRALAADVLLRSEALGHAWFLPELYRTRAILLELGGEPYGEAEADFVRAIEVAERTGALAWRLRAARDFALHLFRQSRGAEGLVILRNAYACFTEGFATPELAATRRLLDSLQASRRWEGMPEAMA